MVNRNRMSDMDTKEKMMRAVVYHGNGNLAFEKGWRRRVSPDGLEAKRKYGDGVIQFPHNELVWFKPLRVGICGTDIAILNSIHGSAPPVVLGHECIGVISAVGRHVRHVAVGDVVGIDPNVKCGVCQQCRVGAPNRCVDLTTAGIFFDGGMAEDCIVPARQAYRLPNDLPYDRAALFEPASCVVHAIAQFPRPLGDCAVIFGGGSIGVLFVFALRARGVRRIAVVEPSSYRAGFLRDLGVALDAVLPPDEVESQLSKDAWDVVIDATGSPEVTPRLVRLARPGAQINLFGQQHAGATVDAFPIVEANQKELTMLGSYATRFEFDETINFLSQDLPFEKIITHKFALEDFDTAFQLMREGKSQKVLFLPNGI